MLAPVKRSSNTTRTPLAAEQCSLYSTSCLPKLLISSFGAPAYVLNRVSHASWHHPLVESNVLGNSSFLIAPHWLGSKPICLAWLQMACVVEPLTASARQSSLRSQNQPGFPPRILEPPCTAWLLLEKEPSFPLQVPLCTACICIRLSVCLLFRPSARPSVCLSVCPFSVLSCLSVCFSFGLSVCLSIFCLYVCVHTICMLSLLDWQSACNVLPFWTETS